MTSKRLSLGGHRCDRRPGDGERAAPALPAGCRYNHEGERTFDIGHLGLGMRRPLFVESRKMDEAGI